jgi:hypothetical protein
VDELVAVVVVFLMVMEEVTQIFLSVTALWFLGGIMRRN